ncbi:MAG: hypothetical protein GC147_03195 [Porphyrobacter sp.]|nr:hypothetical protein [Porphyrobacter sp.]
MPKRRMTGAALAALLVAGGCSAPDDAIDPKGNTFDAVGPGEVVTLTGTEPFWNLRIEGESALWTVPDNQDGTRFAVTRFAGNNGLGFTGTLEGKALVASLTPGNCSDGMSERAYPFVATIALGDETLEGCGYSDSQPFAESARASGGEKP